EAWPPSDFAWLRRDRLVAGRFLEIIVSVEVVKIALAAQELALLIHRSQHHAFAQCLDPPAATFVLDHIATPDGFLAGPVLHHRDARFVCRVLDDYAPVLCLCDDFFAVNRRIRMADRARSFFCLLVDGFVLGYPFLDFARLDLMLAIFIQIEDAFGVRLP